MGLFSVTGGTAFIIFVVIIGNITIISLILAVRNILRWAFYKFYKGIDKITYKPFYKKPITMIFFITTTVFWVPIAYNYLGVYFATPSEYRWFLEDIGRKERMQDMQQNPEKYQKLPCYKVQISDDKYCFDRSKLSSINEKSVEFLNTDKYKKTESFTFKFVSKYVPIDNDDNYLGSVYIEGKNKTVQESILYRSIESQKKYNDFVKKNYNNCAEYTDLLKIKPDIKVVYARTDKSIRKTRAITVNLKKYKENYKTYKSHKFRDFKDNKIKVYQNTGVAFYEYYYSCFENKAPTTYIVINSNESWKSIVKTHYQPLNQKYNFNFNYYSNKKQRKKQVALGNYQIAKEVARFLEDSKVK
jgi:hypothetical protein